MLKPAVLLLDLELPRLGGIRILPSIQSLSPSTKIILLTTAPKLREEIFALKLGAKGYCSKNIGNELLRKAVRIVQSGEVWSGRKVIPNLLEEVATLKGGNQTRSTPKSAVPLDQLTSRKKEVARLVAEGATNREIAQTLHIAESTVKAHLTDILRKLQLSSRLNLAVLIASQKTRLGGLGLIALVISVAQKIQAT
jgi:two-component system, NarL family, nitrate/nitrite response regulator NarL